MNFQTGRNTQMLPSICRSIMVFCVCMFVTGFCQAGEDIWKLLKRDGDVLDLMAIESVEDKAILIAAKYIEKQWEAGEEPAANQADAPLIRKLLHLISVNNEEQVEWENSYSAIPDVDEIYSSDKTPNGRICIAYGHNYADDEFINPTVLQIDSAGKIIWANRSAIPKSSLPETSGQSYTQIANIESIRIVGSLDNGCLMGYILRQQTSKGEFFQLNLLLIDEHGNQQWHFSHNTELYGKMFLVRNSGANNYAVLQTNQSRDAAIEAMMAGRPFSPITNLVTVSKEGKLSNFFDGNALPALSKAWIKHAIDAPGEDILLVGILKNAWAGLMDPHGKLAKVNNSLDGEFSRVEKSRSNQYMLVRGDALVVLDGQLEARLDKPIDQLVNRKYVNAYVEKKLQEQGPVQNIVPMGKNAYFILYKLASRLKKIVLSD